MKHFLAKLRISSCLDEGQPISAALQRQIDKSPELRAFARRTRELHERLRQPHSPHPVCVGLEDSIHSTVRDPQTYRQVRVSAAPRRMRWACALAIGVLLAVWIGLRLDLQLLNGRPTRHEMPSAAAALEQGEQVALSASERFLAPLTDEWRHLNLDLEKTADYLLASLP